MTVQTKGNKKKVKGLLQYASNAPHGRLSDRFVFAISLAPLDDGGAARAQALVRQRQNVARFL
jgi:hypothetical protein